MKNKSIRVAIVGLGAIGSFYGGKLKQAGVHLSVFPRSDYDHVKKYGVKITSIWGDFQYKPDDVYASI